MLRKYKSQAASRECAEKLNNLMEFNPFGGSGTRGNGSLHDPWQITVIYSLDVIFTSRIDVISARGHLALCGEVLRWPIEFVIVTHNPTSYL